MEIILKNKFGMDGVWFIELKTTIPCLNMEASKLSEIQSNFLVATNEKITPITLVISESFKRMSQFYKVEPTLFEVSKPVITANNQHLVMSVTIKIINQLFKTKRIISLKLFVYSLDKISGKKKYPKEYIQLQKKSSNPIYIINWLFSDNGIKFLELANVAPIPLEEFIEIMAENNIKSPYSITKEEAILDSIRKYNLEFPTLPLVEKVTADVTKFTKNDILTVISIAQQYRLVPTGHRERWEKHNGQYKERKRRLEVTVKESKNFLKKVIKKYGSKYDLNKVKYVNGKTRVMITCCNCGSDFTVRPTYFIGNTTDNGEKCPNCYRQYAKDNKQAGSKGENKVAVFFDKKKIKYCREEALEGCINPVSRRHLPMDFFVPSLNLVIEFMGGQHYKQTEYFGNRLESIAFKDGLREGYCASKGIKYVSINYKEENKIAEILTPYLYANSKN